MKKLLCFVLLLLLCVSCTHVNNLNKEVKENALAVETARYVYTTQVLACGVAFMSFSFLALVGCILLIIFHKDNDIKSGAAIGGGFSLFVLVVAIALTIIQYVQYLRIGM